MRANARPTLEATHHGKTRSRGLGAGAEHRSSRRSARPVLQGHPRRRARLPRKHRRPRRRHARRRDRRPRRSSATPGCGLFRPRRCSRAVSGPAAGIAAAPTTSRVHQRRRLRRDVRRRCRRPRRNLRIVPRRHAHRPRPAAALRRRPAVRRRRRSVSAGEPQWTGDNIGDFYVGAKINFCPSTGRIPRRSPSAASSSCRPVRRRRGVSTGKTDFALDFIASKEASKTLELSGYAGYEFRGSPDGFDIPTSAFRWGAGAGFPSRSPLRVTAN